MKILTPNSVITVSILKEIVLLGATPERRKMALDLSKQKLKELHDKLDNPSISLDMKLGIEKEYQDIAGARQELVNATEYMIEELKLIGADINEMWLDGSWK